MLLMLAETTASDITPWLTGGGTVGGFAMVCWAFRHLMVKVIPDMQAGFAKEMDEQRKQYEKDFAIQRELFTTELRASRQDYRDEIKHITERHEKQMAAERNVLQSIVTMHQASHAAVVASRIPEQEGT